MTSTLPHKKCSVCGQPAVMEMVRCRRCGSTFDSSGVQGTVRGGPNQRVVGLITLAAGLLFVLFVAGAAISRRHRHEGLNSLIRRNVRGSRNLLSQSSRQGGGMFIESPSGSETPTIYLTNEEDDTISVTFRDVLGHTYQAQSSSGRTAALQLPAGVYAVNVASDNPMIRSNSGQAVFRKFRSYQAAFAHAPFAPPIRLGDGADDGAQN